MAFLECFSDLTMTSLPNALPTKPAFHSVGHQVFSTASKTLHREGPSCFATASCCILLIHPTPATRVFPVLLLIHAWWEQPRPPSHLTLCLLQTLIPESPGPQSQLCHFYLNLQVATPHPPAPPHPRAS